MKRKNLLMALALIAATFLGIMGLGFHMPAYAADAEYTVLYWVERPNLQGDPGDPTEDPEAKENYILFDKKTRQAQADSTVALTAAEAGECLRTAGKQRRFASFLSSDEAQVSADGTTELNVYYARDVFTYSFNLANEQSEMTLGDEVYTGSGERYTIYGKYEQQVIVPGIDNGSMPQNTNPALPGAYCAGWALDERVGSKELLTYTDIIIENMLPTDDMLGGDLVFELRGVWYDGSEQHILACWYEQLPEHEALENVNRTTYNGKVYVNFPATDFEVSLPKGSKPEASSAPGLTFVARIDADTSISGAQGRTWQLLYDRDRYSVTFDTDGADEIPAAGGVMYQQNLWSFDPGWGEETTRTSGAATYRFAGWHINGNFVAYSLGEIYMPAKDITLHAVWERVE